MRDHALIVRGRSARAPSPPRQSLILLLSCGIFGSELGTNPVNHREAVHLSMSYDGGLFGLGEVYILPTAL